MWRKCGYFCLRSTAAVWPSRAGRALFNCRLSRRPIHISSREGIHSVCYNKSNLSKPACPLALLRFTHPPEIEESKWSRAELMGRQWHVKEGECVLCCPL